MTGVVDYQTGERLDGVASEGLILASCQDPAQTGAVAAYRDESGVWQHVPDSEVSRYEAQGETVTTVYVDDPEPMVRCHCGDLTGERCAWCGDASETVEIEYIPRHRHGEVPEAREIDSAAGWQYAVRARLERSCAASILSDEDWQGFARPAEQR